MTTTAEHPRVPDTTPTVVYAMGRDETEACQAGTDGCCIDHVAGTDTQCEAW